LVHCVDKEVEDETIISTIASIFGVRVKYSNWRSTNALLDEENFRILTLFIFLEIGIFKKFCEHGTRINEDFLV
jgi:hypothetical protein